MVLRGLWVLKTVHRQKSRRRNGNDVVSGPITAKGASVTIRNEDGELGKSGGACRVLLGVCFVENEDP